jgi:hypothetical protein
MILAERVDTVALLALVYRELYNARYGERGGAEALADDFQTCPSETSLVLIIGSASLHEFDWTIVRALDYPETLPALVDDLYEFDSRRGEALLHAWPSEATASRIIPFEFLNRWEAVEDAMAELCDLGIARPREDVWLTALDAYQRGTGATLSQAIDRYAE